MNPYPVYYQAIEPRSARGTGLQYPNGLENPEQTSSAATYAAAIRPLAPDIPCGGAYYEGDSHHPDNGMSGAGAAAAQGHVAEQGIESHARM
ncbi:MAG TPA: hypothetical protein VHI13_21530 [Candidatus Kapabacteria bacterium]|nr:hypothetical protein [Candidatus Kapabacteria bacterium]